MSTLPPGESTRRFLAVTREQSPPIDAGRPATVFKRYPEAVRLLLPEDDAVGPAVPELALVGHILRNLLGVMHLGWAHLPVPEGRSGWRTELSPLVGRPVPSGGQSYPIEAYLVGGSRGVPAGLHHYDPAHHTLELVRDTDHRPALRQTLASSPPAPSDLIIVLTAIFWRTGRTYGDFAYQLQCQETGALIAQFLAVTAELELDGRAHLCFDGPRINYLLALDPAAEGTLVVLSLSTAPTAAARSGPGDGSSGTDVPSSPPGSAEADPGRRPATGPADPPAPVDRDLPYLHALHTAATAAGNGGGVLPALHLPEATTAAVALPDVAQVPPATGIERRHSAPAGFATSPVDLRAITKLVRAAADGYLSDFPATSVNPAMTGLYLLALRVDGLAVGGYRYRTEDGRLEAADGWPGPGPIARSLRHRTALAFGEAAAVLLPVGDPLAGAAQLGDRWYRLQQIEAGIVLHRAALAAAALGLVARLHSDLCTEATDAALNLGATSHRTLSALAVGEPPRRTPLRWTAGRPISGTSPYLNHPRKRRF